MDEHGTEAMTKRRVSRLLFATALARSNIAIYLLFS